MGGSGLFKERLNMEKMDPKKDILHRAKIIEGHCKKVVKMIEDGDYCIDVLNQSLAVQNAMKKMDEALLERHLNTCVVSKIKAGKTKEAAEEVLEVFKRRA
jgi:DNA-binding FrmR family transcriptional regulator